MNTVCRILFFILFSVVIMPGTKAFSQNSYSEEDSVKSIVKVLSESESIRLQVPPALSNRLRYIKFADSKAAVSDNSQPSAATPKAGYRIIVFDDNNPRSAQSEAQGRKRLMESKFPYRAYVVFDSPYWKVKVGDFRTRSEAEAALDNIRAEIPSLSKTMRIIRDRINVF